MGLNDIVGKKQAQNVQKKAKVVLSASDGENKVNKSIRMKESTFLLLKKVTNRIEEESGKYTHEDAILDGLMLLAKEKGIDV